MKKNKRAKKYVWRRPHEFIKGGEEIKIFGGDDNCGIHVDDIQQGDLGDCYFLVALSSMTA